MTISREMREALLTVLSPVPWLILLLPVLSVSDSVDALAFLFVFSLVIAFFYLIMARSVNIIRSNLAERKDNVPTTDEEYEGSTYRGRFWNITHEVFFGLDSDVEPITEYTKRRPFPHLVYSFWGLIASGAMFFVSAVGLAWLVTSGNLNSLADTPIPQEAIQAAPLGLFDLLLAFFPIFDGLSFENQVFVGGVVLFTAFFFLTAARNLSEVSDDIHRRVLQHLVTKNPFFKNEFLNTIVLAAVYALISMLRDFAY